MSLKDAKTSQQNDIKWVKVEAAAKDSKFWSPTEVDEELVGTITEVGEDEYGAYICVKTDSGRVIQTKGHSILQARLKAVELDIGMLIKIIYKGKTKTKRGSAFDYDLFVVEE